MIFSACSSIPEPSRSASPAGLEREPASHTGRCRIQRRAVKVDDRATLLVGEYLLIFAAISRPRCALSQRTAVLDGGWLKSQ